jgi:hypothetical protein
MVANITVSRDQFNVTPEGITHKPAPLLHLTPAIPSESIRAGQLDGYPRTGE